MDITVLSTIVVAAIAVITAVVGGVRWQVSQQQRIAESVNKQVANLGAELHKATEILHGRINDVREQYVRRDDLAVHLAPLNEGQKRLETSLLDLNRRLDDVFRPPARGAVPAK